MATARPSWVTSPRSRTAPQTGPLRVSNVVFMGMGEALANYKAAIGAIRRLVDPSPAGLGMSARSLTMSTVGLVPGIDRLATEGIPVTLALSLHAPDDELRDTLVPINTRFKVGPSPRCRPPLFRGDQAAGEHRVRPHPGHQRPGLAGRPPREEARRPGPWLGARQPDPAEPDTWFEVDCQSPRRRAAVRRAAARPRHTDHRARHQRLRHRRGLWSAGCRLRVR
jgi:hypothetical protein